MPFKSKAQQRWMFANHPKMAKRWADETSNIKDLPEKKKKKMAKGGSIVDTLNAMGKNSSKEARAQLARELGIENYDFSAEKNIELLNKLPKENNNSIASVNASSNISFGAAFRQAADSGATEFSWRGKKYTTEQGASSNPRVTQPTRSEVSTRPRPRTNTEGTFEVPQLLQKPANYIDLSPAAPSPVNGFNPGGYNPQGNLVGPVPLSQSGRNPFSTGRKIQEVSKKPSGINMESLRPNTTGTPVAAPVKVKKKTAFEQDIDSLKQGYDTVVETVSGYINGAQRKIEQVQEEDKRSIIPTVKDPYIFQGKQAKKDSRKEFGYRELGVVPDIKNPKDSLVAFENYFDNDAGGTYFVGNKQKEVTDAGAKGRYDNVEAVAHFLRDGDILPNQKIAPNTWSTVKGYKFTSTSPGKTITSTGLDDPDKVTMLYKQNKDGSHNIKYVKNRDITPQNSAGYEQDFTVSSHKYSDIDWNGKGESTGYASKSNWVPLKGGKGRTSIPFKDKDGFSRFSGGSGIYIFKDPETGKSVGVDVSGSVNQLKTAGQKILSTYGIKESDLEFAYHDMGSYSAKPKSHDGVLDYNQWDDYNTYNRGFSGAPIMIPKNKKQLGGTMKMQNGGTNLFNWRGEKQIKEEICPPGWTWSAPDNMCVQDTPTINTRDMSPQVSAPQELNPDGTPNYSAMMQSAYNPNAPITDVGANMGPQDPENSQILEIPSKQKGNNKLLDPYFALQGLETGLAWLGSKKERNRQDQYMYNQYNTLGQNAPVNVQDYQPNRFSMYAKYGGKLKKKGMHRMPDGSWMRDDQMQAGGRLVDKVPAGYVPVPGQPNYFSRTTEGSVQGNVRSNGTAPMASNQQWAQFLASPAGQQWQAKQRQTDTVYTRQPAPTQPMQPRVQPLRGVGNEYMWRPTDGVAGNRIMGSIQDVVRQSDNNLLAGTEKYNDIRLFQDMNDLAQPIGQPFPISRSEVFGTGRTPVPVTGQQKLDSSRNAYQERLAMALSQKALGGNSVYRKGGIHIKPENRGKFTATKKRTGKTTEELTHSKNPLTRKRAIFAQNARKWKH